MPPVRSHHANAERHDTNGARASASNLTDIEALEARLIERGVIKKEALAPQAQSGTLKAERPQPPQNRSGILSATELAALEARLRAKLLIL